MIFRSDAHVSTPVPSSTEPSSPVLSSGKIRYRKDDELCEKQVALLYAGYQAEEDWAMRIYDSWGKSQSGLLSGNLINFGHYEQCLSTLHTFEDRHHGTFFGQHCMIFFNETAAISTVNGVNGSATTAAPPWRGNLTIDMVLSQVMNIKLIREYSSRYQTRLGTALCLPSLCTAEKVREIADTMLGQHGMSTINDYNQEDFCNVINILEIRSIDLLAM